jgi:Tfp pilus assembly protein PilO
MAKDMSFLPEDYLEGRIAQRTNIICLTLFVIVMGGVVAAWFVTDRQRSDVKRLQAQVNQQFEDAARKLEQVEKLQQQKAQMLRKADITSALVEKLPRSRVLAELTNTMPASLSLLEFELDTKVVSARPRALTAMQDARRRAAVKQAAEQEEPEVVVPETEVNLSLVGVAPSDVDVAKYIASLTSHVMFEDVTLKFSEQTKIEGAQLRKFALAMQVTQNAAASEVEPTLIKRELKMNPMANTIYIDESGELVNPPAGSVADVPTENQ